MSYLIHKELSNKILGLAFNVQNTLGPGLLEHAYEGAFCVELIQAGIFHERQKVFPLTYKGEYIGAYFADIVVDNTIILEIKAVKQLTNIMNAQVINYLKLSGLPVGYLINFNSIRLEWRRFINQRE